MGQKRCIIWLGFIFLSMIFSVGCSHRTEKALVAIYMVDRNGFKETISHKERLSTYEKVDFLIAQPYAEVTRIYNRNEQGQTRACVTSYHENGEPWQYLEVVNGRARGLYREWYQNGQLSIEAFVLEGLGLLQPDAHLSWVFDGISRAWDRSGQLLAEISYVKGLLEGDSLYYHPTGHLAKVIPYKNHQIEGTLILYHTDGEERARIPFVNGMREGEVRGTERGKEPSYVERYKNDRLIEATYYNLNGRVVSEIREGVGNRPTFVDGRLATLTEYHRGVPEGLVEMRNEVGQVVHHYTLKDGCKHGEEWFYFPCDEEKRPRLCLSWCRGILHGVARSWYENGSLESQREIYENKKQGISSAWYKDGSLMLVEEYEQDLLKQGKYMRKGDLSQVSEVRDGEGVVTIHDGDGFFLSRAHYRGGRPKEDA